MVAKKTTTSKPSSRKTASVDVEMVVDRDTKNTRRYAAVEENDVLDTLYVKKGAFAQMPDSITLTITAG